jgi:hypothetical protein
MEARTILTSEANEQVADSLHSESTVRGHASPHQIGCNLADDRAKSLLTLSTGSRSLPFRPESLSLVGPGSPAEARQELVRVLVATV